MKIFPNEIIYHPTSFLFKKKKKENRVITRVTKMKNTRKEKEKYARLSFQRKKSL